MQGEPSPASSRREQVVLVVDDFEDNRAMYAEYLRHAGYRVIEPRTGVKRSTGRGRRSRTWS